MSIVDQLFLPLALFGSMLVALEIGFRAGLRARASDDPRAAGQVGAIQGAVLGLLGLLLAFSFAAAASRFLERQDLIVEEANAIGTAYLRADLLDDAHRSELRAALRKYTERRIEVSAQLGAFEPAHQAEIDQMQARIWSAAIDGVDARPSAMLGVLPPVNEVIDLHSTRIAAGRKHIPLLVLGLLIASSLLAISVIGYGCGMAHQRRAPLTIALALLVGAALGVTIDLDRPRAGLLQISDAPLKALDFDAMGRRPAASK